MYRDRLNSLLETLSPETSKCARSNCWQLVWIVLLLVIGTAVGVYAASGDPEWVGTDPTNISDSETNKAWQPSIAAGQSGQIFVAWSDQESTEATRNIYLRRSHDYGRTWSAREAIAETVLHSALPDVHIVGSQAYVAWVDQLTVGGVSDAIYEAQVGAGGARQIPSPVSLSSTGPRLAAGAGRLHVVFNAGANILHASRPLAATAWPTATAIHTSTATLGPWFPVLAIGPDEETLHVVWQEKDFVLQEWTIIYSHGEINDAKVDWSPAHILSTGNTELVYPAIGADSRGNLHVVWGEVVGAGGLKDQDQYVRYMRYDAAASQWISPAIRIDDVPMRVNQDNPTYTAPSLTLFEKDDQVEVCVAWHGFRAGGLAEDVLLSCSEDGGESWSAPQNVSHSGDSDEISISPSIAFDASGRLHSVWQEHKSAMGSSVIDNYQIFHSGALNKVYLPIVARNQG